jgi:hypothetical protein
MSCFCLVSFSCVKDSYLRCALEVCLFFEHFRRRTFCNWSIAIWRFRDMDKGGGRWRRGSLWLGERGGGRGGRIEKGGGKREKKGRKTCTPAAQVRKFCKTVKGWQW